MSVEIRTFVLERDHGGPFHVLPEDAGDFIPAWILERVKTIEKAPVLDLLERARTTLVRWEYGEVSDAPDDPNAVEAAAVLADLTTLLHDHGRLVDLPDKREG